MPLAGRHHADLRMDAVALEGAHERRPVQVHDDAVGENCDPATGDQLQQALDRHLQ
jgi:hypothetical protein